MAKEQVFELGSYVAKGRTKTEAKAKAMEFAANALDGRWTPLAISWRGAIAFVFRTPYGWEYAISRITDLGNKPLYGIQYDDYWDTVHHATSHLIQNGWEPGKDDPKSLATTCPFASDRLVKELQSWCDWQHLFAEAKKTGHTDEECRHFANYGCFPDSMAEVNHA